jgi:hypothetical protein
LRYNSVMDALPRGELSREAAESLPVIAIAQDSPDAGS